MRAALVALLLLLCACQSQGRRLELDVGYHLVSDACP
jgi:hypothetical protein